MAYTPSYQEAHLVVAAIRILHHQQGSPPTPEQVASLLHLPKEKVFVLVHELRTRNILHAMESPFEIRLDVLDPKPLEALPKTDGEPEMKGELDDFFEREKEKKAEMDRMFRGGEADKRRQDRVKRMEEEFRK